MATFTLEEAQARLPELLRALRPGEEFTVTDHGAPVAQIKKAVRTSWPCKAGSYTKAEFWMAPDFDAPLDDFNEYMACRVSGNEAVQAPGDPNEVTRGPAAPG